jgi:uncharacterized phage protein (TIGR01671 family)
MNRQIKFRVWNGYSMEYRVLAGALGHFYVEGMSKKDSACLSDANTIYNEATPLMQFTGLLDKNGKEIYEDDIVKINLGNNDSFGVVKWDHKRGAFYHTVDFQSYNGIPYWDAIKIAGNIHANPELLSNKPVILKQMTDIHGPL